MRKFLVACFAAVLVVAGTSFVNAVPVNASPAQEYDGPYFGDGNLPPGCIRDKSVNNLANTCFHMKTGFNSLDSPKVDVLVLVPASPTAERDMRIMRQTVEMWEGGIDYLAEQMGLGWLAEGMDFHVTVDSFDPVTGAGGEFTTYPVVDPEIVVVSTNDGPPHGIGVEPVDFTNDLEGIVDTFTKSMTDDQVGVDFVTEDMVPCHNVPNPFDFEYWSNLPGFDSHHEARSGTYVEDCGGAGGNICFAINNLIDPAPDLTDGTLGIFDTVAHEIGHCLTLGHVGDGGGGPWGPVPYDDIMAYSGEPAGLNKCVSTLDVEGVAVRMSNYLDVNGDGTVTPADRLMANDQLVDDGEPFQVQHPHDHLYASGTGSALHCPQPDLGLVPGPRTDWTPTPVSTSEHALTLTRPDEGAVSDDGLIHVAGTLEGHSLFDEPTASAASVDDAAGDGRSGYTDIVGFDVEATATELRATLRVAEVWPADAIANPVTYSVMVGGQKFDTYRVGPGNPTVYPAVATPTWDPVDKTVELRFAYSSLAAFGIRSPYELSSSANVGVLNNSVTNDRAPEPGHRLVVVPPGTGVGPTGQVHVSVDGVHAASQNVDSGDGTDTFALDVAVPLGTHVLRVDWEDDGKVVATESVTVTHDPDLDDDGILNGADNCAEKANADQADIDGDAKGNVCDADMDGDGYSNAREASLGTDPADPGSYPGSIPRTLF